ncbi:hypothetical protein [Bdellovibrio bacteriovorus]|uniref:hypothetical protein n=1 Tax=Bdellovibrio bacteriovorus TaxID=959 RepID=UPI0035A5AF8B
MKFLVMISILLFSLAVFAKNTKVEGYVFQENGKVWLSQAPTSTDPRYRINWHAKQRQGQICYYEENQACPRYVLVCGQQKTVKQVVELSSCRIVARIKP